MRMRSGLITAAAAVAAFAQPAAAQCFGNCGTGSANGVVTASPVGGEFNYVSTFNGVSGAGLGLSGDRTGSKLTTTAFTAAAGDKLEFYFNYVTSDGAGFADYAYVQLLNGGTTTLFTARTTTSGDTVPGFGLPGLSPGVTLSPASTPIIGGAPSWDQLGGSSGTCYAAGCGYTGWIKMEYVIETAGSYRLAFGVTNWNDNAYQSGLAWDGANIGGNPIGGVPEPATWAMMILGFGMVGASMRRRGIRTVSA